MELSVVFSRSRLNTLLSDLEDISSTTKSEKIKNKEIAHKNMEILDELSKQVFIESKNDYDLRMKAIVGFTNAVREMTFTHFILNFPNDDDGDYTNIENIFKDKRNNVKMNDKLDDSANRLISELNVNKKLNNFKEQVDRFRIDKQVPFFRNGEVNVDYAEYIQKREDRLNRKKLGGN